MSRDAVLSDQVWARIEPVLPSSDGRQGRPFRDSRQVVEGIVYRYRTGVPWRDLPKQFGPWQTVWKRHFRWSTDGTYHRMFSAVQAAGLVDAAVSVAMKPLLSVDSTVVRAHQHAAGARKDSTGREVVGQLAGDTGGSVELQESVR